MNRLTLFIEYLWEQHVVCFPRPEKHMIQIKNI